MYVHRFSAYLDLKPPLQASLALAIHANGALTSISEDIWPSFGASLFAHFIAMPSSASFILGWRRTVDLGRLESV